MVNATAFPTAWGYDKLVGNNETNILSAAVDVWRDSAESGLALDFTFGMIPIMIVAVIYIRTKRMDAAMLGGLMVTLGLKAFNLMSTYTSSALYIILGIGLGLSLAYKFFNKT